MIDIVNKGYTPPLIILIYFLRGNIYLLSFIFEKEKKKKKKKKENKSFSFTPMILVLSNRGLASTNVNFRVKRYLN